MEEKADIFRQNKDGLLISWDDIFNEISEMTHYGSEALSLLIFQPSWAF